jgi:hypothetical protein
MVWTRELPDLRPRHQENLIFMKTVGLSLLLGGTIAVAQHFLGQFQALIQRMRVAPRQKP